MDQGRTVSPVDPIYQASDLLVDAWSWMILRESVIYGVSRFGEFQRRLPIAPKVLAARLARLTSGGLFSRHQLKGRGAPIDYHPTDMGKDFISCLCAAWRWGARWHHGPPPRAYIIHAAGGHPFSPGYCCAQCMQPVQARDVAVVKMHAPAPHAPESKRYRSPALDLMDGGGNCAISSTLRVIGDRWSSLLIREAFLGTRRFGDFERNLGIATNILTNRLDRLVSLGVLMPIPATGSATRHVYRLTDRGIDLYCVPLSILTWSERWLAPGAEPTQLIHKPCGRMLRAVFTCEDCGRPVTFKDLTFLAGGA